MIIPLTSALTSGVFTIDVQGIRLLGTQFSFNGISQGTFFSYTGDQGALGSQVLSLVLSPVVLGAINSDGFLKLTVDGNTGSTRDLIAFDYFQLEAEAVPEPATLRQRSAATRRRSRGRGR